MKKSVRKLLSVLVLLALLSCNSSNKSKESASNNKVEGVYEAVFIDVNATSIDSTINVNAMQVVKKLSNVNLTNKTQFWGEKTNFMLRGLGALTINEAGTYYFRLTSTGKVKLQLNNVDLVVQDIWHQLESKDGMRKLTDGVSIFDYQYFPGELNPHLVLEWSRDGVNFEIVPDMVFGNADLGATKLFEVEDPSDEAVDLNTLTDEEIAHGWKLLFDGESLNGWHTYNRPEQVGSKWKVEDGLLTFEGYEKYFTYYVNGRKFDHGNENKERDGGLDIVTDESFENFELNMEWKISKYGNSGIFYTVQEIEAYDEGWKSSPEMQILDEEGQKDGLIRSHRAGDLYDLIPSNERRTRRQGEWNKVRIIKNKGAIEHWLNGAMMLSYDTNSPNWKDMIYNSKFSKYIENYAKPGPGKIGLQDHSDRIWFRNIKIKEIN
jgi:hypothetical protein